MPLRFTSLTALALAGAALLTASPSAQGAAPPPGFVALYNGKDLSGWRGGDTQDHRKYLAMTPEARAVLLGQRGR